MNTNLDVLLRIFQVFEKSVFTPNDSTLLVRSGVGVTIGHPRLTSEETMEIWPLLVSTTCFDCVALRTLGLEHLGSLLFATSCHFGFRSLLLQRKL